MLSKRNLLTAGILVAMSLMGQCVVLANGHHGGGGGGFSGGQSHMSVSHQSSMMSPSHLGQTNHANSQVSTSLATQHNVNTAVSNHSSQVSKGLSGMNNGQIHATNSSQSHSPNSSLASNSNVSHGFNSGSKMNSFGSSFGYKSNCSSGSNWCGYGKGCWGNWGYGCGYGGYGLYGCGYGCGYGYGYGCAYGGSSCYGYGCGYPYYGSGYGYGYGCGYGGYGCSNYVYSPVCYGGVRVCCYQPYVTTALVSTVPFTAVETVQTTPVVQTTSVVQTVPALAVQNVPVLSAVAQNVTETFVPPAPTSLPALMTVAAK